MWQPKGSITLAAPEAGNFVELHLLYFQFSDGFSSSSGRGAYAPDVPLIVRLLTPPRGLDDLTFAARCPPRP